MTLLAPGEAAIERVVLDRYGVLYEWLVKTQVTLVELAIAAGDAEGVGSFSCPERTLSAPL